jgi:hypothetical protein
LRKNRSSPFQEKVVSVLNNEVPVSISDSIPGITTGQGVDVYGSSSFGETSA